MIAVLVAMGWGLMFGLGVGVAGVARPQVILGFLDVTGVYRPWDPTLLIALSVAVLLYAPLFRWVLRRRSPVMRPRFDLPTARRIDRRLVLGAALFGAGWGMAGMCPGANLVSLGGGDPRILLFAASWVAGHVAMRRLEEGRTQQAPTLRPASSTR